MIRGTLLLRALSVLTPVFLFYACSQEPAFDVAEEANPEAIQNRDLDAENCDPDADPTCNVSVDSADAVGTDKSVTASSSSDDDQLGGEGDSNNTENNDSGNEENDGSNDDGSDDNSANDDESNDDGSDDSSNDGPQYEDASNNFQVQGETRPVDIVITVDNSGSMRQEQQELGAKVAEILDFVKQADWRIALMTTDHSDSHLKLLVDKHGKGTFEQKKSLLQSTIEGFGTSGSGTERGIEQTIVGLKDDDPNAPGSTWLRPNSVVAGVIVSDEDNCSTGSCAEDDQWMMDQIQGPQINRTPGDDARVYALIRRNAGECSEAARVGNTYLAAVNASGGLAGAICDTDYGPTLNAISANIGVVANTTFELDFAPVPSSVQVWINGSEYNGQLEINGKSISLSDANLAPGDEILAEYQYQVN